MEAMTYLQVKTILSPPIRITVKSLMLRLLGSVVIHRAISLSNSVNPRRFHPYLRLGCDSKAGQITLDCRSHNCPRDPCFSTYHFLCNMAINHVTCRNYSQNWFTAGKPVRD